MKKILLSAVLLILSGFVAGQDFNFDYVDAKQVMNSGDYFWYQSEGDFESDEEAEKNAISGLVESVRKGYKSDVVQLGSDSEGLLKSIFSTFEGKIKENAQYILLKPGKSFDMLAYISKEDFDKMCKDREYDIYRYVKIGDNAMMNLNVGDALRNYYIAMMLCCSHPKGNSLFYTDEDNNEKVKLATWLRDVIDGHDGILHSINLNVVKWEESNRITNVELLVKTLSGNLVSNVTLKFFNGRYWERCNVSNGKVDLRYTSCNDMNEYQIEIDMSYKEVEKIEPAAYHMMKYIGEKKAFSNTNIEKTIRKPGEKQNHVKEKKPVEPKTETTGAINKYAVADNIYLENVKLIEKAIRNNDYEPVKHLFTEEGQENLNMMRKYGTASVIGSPEYKFYAFNGEVICRSMPVKFTFNRESYTHDVVFRFDMNTKKVSSIVFRLTDIAEDCIMVNDNWELDSRLVLMNFLEDYQTAYAFKQDKYLEKIFSDNALIIIGHVVDYKPITDDGVLYSNNKKVEYTRKSKGEYISGLRNVFAKNSYVNIHFTDLEVSHSAAENQEVYGVQVHQYYNSSSYSDEGYLFLMVDLRDNLPVIHVRTWQPGKTDVEDLINLSDLL